MLYCFDVESFLVVHIKYVVFYLGVCLGALSRVQPSEAESKQKCYWDRGGGTPG